MDLAEQGATLMRQLDGAAYATVGESGARAAALGGWHSAHWLAFVALAEIGPATEAQLKDFFADHMTILAAPNPVIRALAAHARSEHVWPTSGGTVGTMVTMARRAGLAHADWRGRGRHWWWTITERGETVLRSASTALTSTDSGITE